MATFNSKALESVHNNFPNPIPESPLKESPLAKYPHSWCGRAAKAIVRPRGGEGHNDYNPYYKNRFSYPPVVDLPNAYAPAEGTTLYHYGFSLPSMKARMALYEKKVQWKSNIVDLTSFKHLTPEYCSINPRGTVPTLAVDGRVTTDDREILYYINQTFPGIDLAPKGEDEKVAMEYFIDLMARQNTPALAFGPIPGIEKLILPSRFDLQEKKIDDLKKTHHKNHSLCEIYKHKEEVMDYVKSIVTSPSEMKQVWNNVEFALEEVEHQLTCGPFAHGGWLVSDQFTLADIHTLCFLKYLDVFGLLKFAGPQTHRYYMQGKTRPSFKQAGDDWLSLWKIYLNFYLPTIWHKIGFFSVLFLLFAAILGGIGYVIYALVKLFTKAPVVKSAPKYSGLRADVIHAIDSPTVYVGSTDPWMKWMVISLPALLLIPFFLWVFGCIKCTKRSGRDGRNVKKSPRPTVVTRDISSVEEAVTVVTKHTEITKTDGSDVVVVTNDHTEVHEKDGSDEVIHVQDHEERMDIDGSDVVIATKDHEEVIAMDGSDTVIATKDKVEYAMM